MIHMNEALIVEGRYDKSKLSALTDAIIVTTNGFGIYKIGRASCRERV